MRNIDHNLYALLSEGVSFTALCWRLERQDGVVVAGTEHDAPIEIEGITYAPGAALTGAVFRTSDGLAPAPASAAGALAHDGVTEADLAAGLWDGAALNVLRADWREPSRHICIWSGRLSQVRRGAMGFEADLVSLKADLERPTGRIYTRLCDASLGDARCGVNRARFPGLTCDQRFATCRDVFSNTINFRGFPHLPPSEILFADPARVGIRQARK